MNVALRPNICSSCRSRLPRAAALRCPHCRSAIQRVTPAIRVTCRRCYEPIPASAALKCPSCRSLRPSVFEARRIA
ncbi:hypothetical protein ACFSUD_04980 [Sulfitobacter aestuarii]|uniref:DZANK-type domain-containing protein n=1 Tax=Sulfitobacter aestuarii TaxID=2161676 RepID=A0ABW5U030_9RHOB